ncbi:ABC transporter permease/M1 family aminopeptidase [Sphingobacterium corticibacter]|uniref:Peptidase M1 membrane alanine aminopeptidase domain-containing protein n=1 Tax=Sphingobacterium corticibacter TaxID=2171749 RepID=A0A2T8HML0_9SPHI|nr:M1 family aminopeptidase [Sphingobacterium corticibacter]PVH26688.1 hypothetical protein DC487_03495 [Sphingobacterium corticibacter]
MFSTIFNFEITRWLRNPVFYVYCVLFFAISVFSTMSSLGAFDGVTVTTSSPTYVNSPINIAGFLNAFSTLVYFLLPTIIGASVFRDYQYQVHQVMFSYPLTKSAYLGAKFLSSLLITLLIPVACMLGFFVGQYMPNVNKDLLGPNNILAYLQAFSVLIIPNMVLFGLMVFAVVNYSRNIYVGFIFVLLLFVLQTVLDNMTRNMDNLYTVALLDPFGFNPISYYSKYWSVEEQNTRFLPISGVLLYNRLIWLGVAAVIGTIVYRAFNFSHLGHQITRRKDGTRMVKENFGSVMRIDLPKVGLFYGFWSRLAVAFRLSWYDLKAIVRNWTFIVIMVIAVLMVLIVTESVGSLMGTETYPVTWKLLSTIGSVYSFFIVILVFLFAGILIQRARMAKMDLLVDSTAIPNWALFLSKALALVQMTMLILFISMLTGIGYQAYQGFYHFEVGHYLMELFVLDLPKYMVYILFALFIHSFFKNYFVGFIVCLILFIGLPFLSKIGIEQAIFKFNIAPSYEYSDMNGYGSLREYFYYRLYWFLFAVMLAGLALLFWRRGLMGNLKGRLNTLRQRATASLIMPTALAAMAFLGLGYAIYYHNNVANPYISDQDREKTSVNIEKTYGHYADKAAPRLIDVKLDMAIFPEERDYTAAIRMRYVNKTNEAIDTLFMSHSDNIISESFSIENSTVINDTIADIRIYALARPLQPLDTMEMEFSFANEPNTFLKDKSPILSNGTFLNSSMFPTFAYDPRMELTDNKVRAKYGLPPKDRMPDPTDEAALGNNYISHDADWIDFEATVSTSPDQIAIAPGYLQKEWIGEDGRRYFHYQMDNKMLNFYSIISARFEVMRDSLNDVNLEIYYHRDHTYNLARMMASMKKSLEYYEANFSPYQFTQLRVIEFPKTHGTFAQAFANTVPFSEAIGFIAKVDEDNPNGIDYPYSVIAHEFAHQWWAHQVIGAGVKGATMMSESLAEYSSLKVLEETYGKHQMRRFLKEALDNYLRGRATEQLGENPLMFNENQAYIHYNKGSLAMYALSDLMGEKAFNALLSDYIDAVAFQYPPYTTSLEFVDLLKERVPDSLQYAVRDMYETITLYDNKITNISSKELANGKYEVDIAFQVSKYRTDAKGKKSFEDAAGTGIKTKVDGAEVKSLPLLDYVDIAVFGEPKKAGKHDVENPIYMKRIRIDQINNEMQIIVDSKPLEVGVDPNNKLIDTDSNDNRKKI